MRNIFCIQFILSTNIKTALAFLFYLSQATIVKAPQTNMLQSAITANAGQAGTHTHTHTHTHTQKYWVCISLCILFSDNRFLSNKFLEKIILRL